MSFLHHDQAMRFYYPQTCESLPPQAKLKGKIKADIAILGGGYTGLSAALSLAKMGFNTHLLEANHIGYGASGRNGGHLCRAYNQSMAQIKGRIGKDGAKILWDLGEFAPKFVAQRAHEYNMDCDLHWGYIHAAAKPRHMQDLQDLAQEWDEYGYHDHKLLDKDTLQDKIASKLYHGGLWEGGSGHLNPLKFCIGLAKAALSEGAVIYEQSPVIEIVKSPQPAIRRPALKTADGVIEADYIFIAGNAYLGKLVPELYRHLVGVGSYILATEPLTQEQINNLIPQREAVADTNHVLDYYRIDADNRMIFGGRATYSGLQPRNLHEFTHKRMRHVFPQLANHKGEFVWGGQIGITLDRMPHFGRLNQSIYFAHGYSGHGMALAHLAGDLFAKVIADGMAGEGGDISHSDLKYEKTDFALLARLEHLPFPGGALRRALLSLGMLYHRLLDQF